jgi:nitroimidazol reductase NimA-like FMN-containing flavoprotein (pyridoxamine 5'-phosphate oxidase superfamily)
MSPDPVKPDPPSDVAGPPDATVRISRVPERGVYDRATIDAIIDAALVAHVATVREGKPVVVPMLAARDGDWLLLHGAPAAGSMRRGRNQSVAVSMALLDGLVLARSAFHHSLNYRSVVVLGEAEVIADEDERNRALEVFMERLAPGRQEQLRPTSRVELKQTAVLRLSLARASAKVRSGPPSDDDDDYDWPVWAGVIPVTTNLGQAQPDPRLLEGIEEPRHVRDLSGTER